MKTFTIIIPEYKDRKYEHSKIANTLALTYPAKKVQIIFISGGHSEHEIITVCNSPLFIYIRTTTKGKINQINEALNHAYGEYIVITDIDSELTTNTLTTFNTTLSDTVQCCGLRSYTDGHIIDKTYWCVANLIRSFESWYESASHVIATGYAFKRSLLKSFPTDVIADDVYIALYCVTSGYKVKIARTDSAYEKRGVRTLLAFIRHKTRKGNAVLRELLRFLYLTQSMPLRFKLIYLVRLIQFTILTPSLLLTYPFYKQGSCYEKIY
jgi:cellulose synthase/poly-beta-1,6-N-acetylglucosamine synthase-like glycosyltransferase